MTNEPTPEPGDLLVLDVGHIVRFIAGDFGGWLVGEVGRPHQTATAIAPERVIAILAAKWQRPLPKAEPVQSNAVKSFYWEPPDPVAVAKAAELARRPYRIGDTDYVMTKEGRRQAPRGSDRAAMYLPDEKPVEVAR